MHFPRNHIPLKFPPSFRMHQLISKANLHNVTAARERLFQRRVMIDIQHNLVQTICYDGYSYTCRDGLPVYLYL